MNNKLKIIVASLIAFVAVIAAVFAFKSQFGKPDGPGASADFVARIPDTIDVNNVLQTETEGTEVETAVEYTTVETPDTETETVERFTEVENVPTEEVTTEVESVVILDLDDPFANFNYVKQLSESAEFKYDPLHYWDEEEILSEDLMNLYFTEPDAFAVAYSVIWQNLGNYEWPDVIIYPIETEKGLNAYYTSVGEDAVILWDTDGMELVGCLIEGYTE